MPDIALIDLESVQSGRTVEVPNDLINISAVPPVSVTVTECNVVRSYVGSRNLLLLN